MILVDTNVPLDLLIADPTWSDWSERQLEAALTRALDVPPNRITEIVGGRRAVTVDTALRLARFFGTTAKFWLNLQQSYDLAVAERDNGETIRKAVRPRAA